MSFSTLPHELILIILDQLNIKERCLVRLVCRRFRQLALVTLNELIVNGPDDHHQCVSLLPIVGNQLKRLHMTNVNMNCRVLLKMLRYNCFNLNSLYLDCRCVTDSSWFLLLSEFGSRLEELHFRGSYFCAPDQMESFMFNYLNPDLLQKVSFMCIKSQWFMAFCMKFSRLTHLNVTISEMPQFPILQLLPDLKWLHLSSENGFTSLNWLRNFDDQPFHSFTKLEGLLLEGKLNVPTYHLNLFAHLPSLKTLRLVLHHHHQLPIILGHFARLENLSVHFNSKIDGFPLKSINKLAHLNTLRIEWPCRSLKKLKFSSFKPMPSLRSFVFRAFDCPFKSKYGEDLVKRLPFAFPHLESLEMCTAHWIDPFIFFCTTHRIPSLRSLCVEVSSKNLDDANTFLPSLLESRNGKFCATACCNLSDH